MNLGRNTQLLDFGLVTPSPVALEAGACVGEDLIPSTFLANPAMLTADLNTPKAGLVESEEDLVIT